MRKVNLFTKDERKPIHNHFTKGVFDGELEKPAEVLSWLDDLLTGADIEQVSVEIKLNRLNEIVTV